MEDAFERVDKIMNTTVGELLGKMTDKELENLHYTLKLHLASDAGKNDVTVETLFEAVEYEQIHRD